MSEAIAAATPPAEAPAPTPAPAPEAGVVVSGGQTTAPAAAPAGEAPAPAPVGTIAEGATTDLPAAHPADWPEDWRAKLAGEDKAYLKTLERFNSPADLAKSYRELRALQASGKLKAAAPENATPEQLAAWRADNGIPEKPEEYKATLPNGVVLGEADQPLVQSFQATAHELNMTGGQFSKVMSWYFQEAARIDTERAQQDMQFKSMAEDTLRSEWGQSYRQNVTAVENFAAGMPGDLRNQLFGGRLADGTRIGDHPDFIKWMALSANQLNPYSSLVPSGSADPVKQGKARLDEIRNMQRENPHKYWSDKALQEEELKLIEAEERMKTRAA
jgi:hypothetical protein